MVVLWRVMAQGVITNGGHGGLVAYICTESNAQDISNVTNVGRFTIRVAV